MRYFIYSKSESKKRLISASKKDLGKIPSQMDMRQKNMIK